LVRVHASGTFASRAIVADVALPVIFARLSGRPLDASAPPPRLDGWALRGRLTLPVTWEAKGRDP
jgi:hypothetical protein